MKKVIIAFALFLLILTVSVGAFADTYEGETDYEGEYVTFDDLFSLYMPDTFAEGEVTDEMYDDGIFSYYIDSENNTSMVVQWFLSDDGNDIENAYENLSGDEGYSNVEFLEFNSIPFVVYDAPSKNAFGCMCSDGEDDGGFYVFSFAPDSDESSLLALKIMSSIR